MKRILMVCLGNICRSPLAEGILQSKLHYKEFFVDSAGTAAYHVGEAPDPRSIDVAKKYGIDIQNQKARKFTRKDFNTFDYIYAMDKENYLHIISLATKDSEIDKVQMILNEISSDNHESVPDPYYGGSDGFEKVFHLLNDACEKIAIKRSKD